MDKSFDEQRSSDNKELAGLLMQLIAENSNERFHQILRNYGFISEDRSTGTTYWQNDFYAEPGTVLVRVKEKVKEINELRKQQNK